MEHFGVYRNGAVLLRDVPLRSVRNRQKQPYADCRRSAFSLSPAFSLPLASAAVSAVSAVSDAGLPFPFIVEILGIDGGDGGVEITAQYIMPTETDGATSKDAVTVEGASLTEAVENLNFDAMCARFALYAIKSASVAAVFFINAVISATSSLADFSAAQRCTSAVTPGRNENNRAKKAAYIQNIAIPVRLCGGVYADHGVA